MGDIIQISSEIEGGFDLQKFLETPEAVATINRGIDTMLRIGETEYPKNVIESKLSDIALPLDSNELNVWSSALDLQNAAMEAAVSGDIGIPDFSEQLTDEEWNIKFPSENKWSPTSTKEVNELTGTSYARMAIQEDGKIKHLYVRLNSVKPGDIDFFINMSLRLETELTMPQRRPVLTDGTSQDTDLANHLSFSFTPSLQTRSGEPIVFFDDRNVHTIGQMSAEIGRYSSTFSIYRKLDIQHSNEDNSHAAVKDDPFLLRDTAPGDKLKNGRLWNLKVSIYQPKEISKHNDINYDPPQISDNDPDKLLKIYTRAVLWQIGNRITSVNNLLSS